MSKGQCNGDTAQEWAARWAGLHGVFLGGGYYGMITDVPGDACRMSCGASAACEYRRSTLWCPNDRELRLSLVDEMSIFGHGTQTQTPHHDTGARACPRCAMERPKPLPPNKPTHRFPIIPNLPRRDRGLPWSIVLGRHRRRRGPPRISGCPRTAPSRPEHSPLLPKHEGRPFRRLHQSHESPQCTQVHSSSALLNVEEANPVDRYSHHAPTGSARPQYRRMTTLSRKVVESMKSME